jgi:molecular chaperone DnaK (HSP70)
MRTALPYDVRPQLGKTTNPVLDAFAERGGTAPQIVSVTMEGGTWRLTELQAGTAFTVTQADCDHAGNRATGRDRVFVTWKHANQTQSTDHLDIRYCDR